jgi:hypothetical protein
VRTIVLHRRFWWSGPFLLTAVIWLISLGANSMEPEGIRSGSAIFYPFAAVALGFDDNVLTQPSNRKESAFTLLTAGVDVLLAQEESKDIIQLTAEVESGIYASSSSDDYTDSDLVLDYILQPNDKSRLSASARIQQLHDPRSPATLATRPSLDVYSDTGFEGEWYYGINDWEGADSSLTINSTDRSYKSNRSINRTKNHQSTFLSGLLRFPLAPNMRLRLSVRVIDLNYDIENSRDSNQLRIRSGVDWQMSEITLLSAEVGFQEKNFDQSIIEDHSDLSWEAKLTWAPEKFNIVEITTNQDFSESINEASYVSFSRLNLDWIYNWDDFIRATTSVGTLKETSETVAGSSVDDINYTALAIEYDLQKSIQMTALISNTHNSSDILGNSSDKLVISIGLTAAF